MTASECVTLSEVEILHSKIASLKGERGLARKPLHSQVKEARFFHFCSSLEKKTDEANKVHSSVFHYVSSGHQ